MIGSCTNGSYDDLLQGALVIHEAARLGLTKVAREFRVFPGSGGVSRLIELPDQRLGGESIANVFRGVGAVIRQSWCGSLLRSGRRRAGAGAAGHHHVQPELAESHGLWRRRLPGESGRRGRQRSHRIHGPSERARSRVGSCYLRRLKPGTRALTDD
jgi:hypothetical protein